MVRKESEMDARPQARKAGVIAETIGEGIRIFDTEARRRHDLDTVTARVWLAADGELSVGEVAAAANIGYGAAVAALDGLRALGLLVSEPIVARRNGLDFSAPLA
jgi:hypothetical protein